MQDLTQIPKIPKKKTPAYQPGFDVDQVRSQRYAEHPLSQRPCPVRQMPYYGAP